MERAIEVRIGGMNCDHCVRTIRSALADLPGVKSCSIGIGLASVQFDDSTISRSALLAAIRDAGPYEILGFSTHHE